MKPKNDQLLRTIKHLPTDYSPVWLMGQSRLHKSWGQHKPADVAEATAYPVTELNLDAAELALDPLYLVQLIGLEYKRTERGGIDLPITITQPKDLDILHVPQPKEFEAIAKAVQAARQAVDGKVPLIGVLPAPWTLFTWITEGREGGLLSTSRRLAYQQPEMTHRLLQNITSTLLNAIKVYLKAGVDIVQLSDETAWVLGQTLFQRYALEYVAQICDAVYEVPILVFARGAHHSLDSIATLNCQAIGIDWTMHVKQSNEYLGGRQILQGNLDPAVLLSDKATIREEVNTMLEYFGPDRHIVNTGDYLMPGTSLESIKWLVETVRTHTYAGRY